MPINEQEIITKLKSGEYVLRKPIGAKSHVWSDIDAVFDTVTNKSIYVKCRKCGSFLAFSGGTSTLSKHLASKQCGATPQLSIINMLSVQKTPKAPLSVKSNLADSAAIWCGKDIRPESHA